MRILCDRLRSDTWLGVPTKNFILDAIQEYHSLDQWHTEVEFTSRDIEEMNDRLATRMKYQLEQMAMRTVECAQLKDGYFVFGLSYHKYKRG